MNKFLFFVLLLLISVEMAHAQPAFKTSSKQSIVSKRTDSVTLMPLIINWKDASKLSANTTAILKVESLGERDLSLLLKATPPKSFSFGADFSNEYPISIHLLPDSDLNKNITDVLKFTLSDEKTAVVYDSFVVLYQRVPKKEETTLAKPIAELKQDLYELKRQILEGDTSQAYLGKFVKKDKIISVLRPSLDLGKLKLLDGDYTYEVLSGNRSVLQRELNKKKIGEVVGISTKFPKVTETVEYAQKEIAEVRLKLTDGFIEYIRATTKDNTIFSYSRPISVSIFDKYLDKKVYTDDRTQFVFLGDILALDTHQFLNYIPDDNIYNLVNDPPIKKEGHLTALSGLGSLIDLRLYTDLLGTFGDQPNGLVQIEATSKLPLSSLNTGHLMFFNYIQPFFKLSKLDSKFDTILVSSNAQGPQVNRMELFQRSFLNVGIKANIFKVNWRPNGGVFFNVGYNFSSGNISIGKDSLTKGGIHMPYGELGFSSKKLQNFGFEAEARYGWQKLNKNKYFDGSGWDNVMSISTSMFFFPTTKSQDKFFVRFMNFLNFQDRTYDFYQLQLGYSLNLRLRK